MVSSGVEEAAAWDGKDQLEGFLKWMQVNGAQLRGCTLKLCEGDSETGFGVYTTEGHPEGGVLMATPLALAITPMTALQDPTVGSVFAKLFEDGNVDDRLVVMLFLLVERLRGDNSFWAPYLKILPTKFGMTICFTEEELLELKGTALYKATKIQHAGLKQHFTEKVKGLAETILNSIGWFEREVEFEDFLWANCVFWTRALNIPCPMSLVFPNTLPSPMVFEQAKENFIMPGTEGVGCERLDITSLHTMNGQHEGSSGFPQQNQNVARGPDYCEESKLAGREVNCLPQSAVQSSSADGKALMGNGDQNSSEIETSESFEGESTVWVEGLVPGIDVCNHAVQQSAAWDVDDCKGSASGVQYSMYLVSGPGALESNSEVCINYGNKANEELLYLYGFVVDDNPDDYLMIHFPKAALEQAASADAKILLLEEQKLPLRWLLPSSLLEGHYRKEQGNKSPSKQETMKRENASLAYSWSGHRKPPPDLEKQTFPEELLAALRIVAMTEDEVQGTTALLQEISDPDSQRVPSVEDIGAAVWEVCGNAGALQLLVDLLTSLMVQIEEGTMSADVDSSLLENDSKAQMLGAKKQRLGSAHAGDEEFIEKNLLSRNRRACVLYRKGQKQLVQDFLKEAEYALQRWIK